MILLFPILLILFLILGLWLAHIGGKWAYKKTKYFFAYIGGFVVVFLLVFGDEIGGHYYWQHLCSTEAGLHVYKKVPVEGFWYNEGAADGVARDFLGRKGFEYRYIEGTYNKNYGKDRDKMYLYTLNDAGYMVRTEIAKPQSRYMKAHAEVKYPHFVWTSDEVVTDTSTNQVIGIYRLIGYQGSAVIKILREITGTNFEGSASYCGYAAFGKNIITETIPPIQSIEGASKP